MAAPIKPGWSRPSTILFATELPPNEKAFAFALAQAAEFGAELVIFHAFDRLETPESNARTIHIEGYASARDEKRHLEPFAQRAMNLGIHCSVIVRPGQPAARILKFMRERKVDRVVMGAHSPGPIGKLLVGSVAEEVLRSANAPVCIVGPNVIEGTYRNLAARRILCDVSKQEASRVVASFGAELAAGHKANLILQQVISPEARAAALANRSIAQIEAELPALVPVAFRDKIALQTKVALGDPIEELLYQGRAQQAHLIVLGAQGASHFAAVTRAGTVYKVLAYAHCPVVTLSPVLLAECGAIRDSAGPAEVNYLAGVI